MTGRASFLATVFLCLAVCARQAHAACPDDDYESCGAGCFQVCDCSFEKVSAAVADAPAGSTVNVPAGDCTWSGNLVITKGINLIGAGMDRTVIASAVDSDYLISYDPSDLDADDPFRLSGFSFDMRDTSLFELGHGGMDAPFTVQTKIRIDHNRFYNAPGPGHQAIWNHSGMFGVADSNRFDDVAYPIRSDAGVGDSSFWDYFTFTLGAADNNLYFEDSTFTGVSAGIVSDCQYSGRYAFRYNTIETGADSYPLFDMHGNQYSSTPGASMWSCFGGELYGNRIEAGSSAVNLLDQRGGKAVVFYNAVATTSTYSSPVFIKSREEYDDALCPTTSAQPQHVSESYYWNNRVNSDLVPASNDLAASGTHDGPGDSSTLSDSTAAFPYSDSYVGLYLHNVTDGSKCRITSNTETTADCALDGGSENDWDAGDGYTIENDCCRAIAMNSEYYADNTDFAADPTYGVGCGTLASRPAACTPRVGYWATDQSCTDLAGMVGADPSTPISGTLYVCTAADTWTEYYTPIPYPHPLRRQPCAALGGSCCAAGQECQGGRFDISSDCASLCCVGGTCAAAPDPVADGPADAAENDGLDADAGDGGEQEGGDNGGCGCILAG
jgi:hypothetical protein